MTKTRKGLSILTLTCFYMTSLSAQAALPPLSLAEMYNYASNGKVRVLRVAVQRGLNIDTTDRNGNTGLCYAILQNNITAYNTFKAAGANPRHGCTYNIPSQQYQNFMAKSSVYKEEQTAREAYQHVNRGEFIVSKKVWWIGGAVLLGAGAALAFSGGGGGGGGSSATTDNYTPTDDSLSTFAGTKKPTLAPNNYKAVEVAATSGDRSNLTTLDISNDNQNVDSSGTTTDVKDLINFSGNILENIPYLRVGMKTFGEYIVENTTTGLIKLSEATAGLVADRENSRAVNLGTIQINSSNATIGIVAGGKATGENDNDILMSFEGTEATDQIIAMYADTLGQITNQKNITGVTSTGNSGTMIGMEGRLINQEASPTPTQTTKLINTTTGDINLSTSATGTGTTNSINLVGMGSFLDSDFLSGEKLVRRTGYVEIENNGSITLSSALNSGATYDYATYNVKNGKGIIGILADAHTTATNNGTISVDVTSTGDDKNDYQYAHAGMVSAHGGTISNSGNITISGGSYGYGMIGIRGEGTNPEFNSLYASLTNNGTITIKDTTENGFGMASYNGGTILNNNTIILENIGTGIYADYGTIKNETGAKITLQEGGIGIHVEPASGKATASNTIITNAGEIEILNASDSSGIRVSNATVNNNGTINLVNLTATPDTTSYGIYAKKGKVTNNGTINVNILNGTDTESYGIYSEEAEVINGISRIINLTYKGTGIYADKGKVTNSTGGVITLNDGGTGIETKSGFITNSGNITVSNATDSYGLKTVSGNIVNDSQITLSQANNSYGLFSETGNLTNNNSITLSGTGSNSYAMSSTSGTITNNRSINLSDITNGIGINNGTGETHNLLDITVSGTSATGIKSGGKVSNGSAADSTARINVTGKDAKGVELASTSPSMDNYGSINVSSTEDGTIYGIYSSATGTVTNRATGKIILTGNGNYDFSVNKAYGIFGNSTGEIINSGSIALSGLYGYGIYSSGNVYNNSSITLANGGEGISGNGGTLVNRSGATITITGDATDGVSYGMNAVGGTARNAGTITIGDVNSFGIYATVNGINEGMIHLLSSANGSTAMAGGSSSVLTNAAGANIFMAANQATGMSTDGKAINNGTIATDSTYFSDITAMEGTNLTNSSTGVITLNIAASSDGYGMTTAGITTGSGSSSTTTAGTATNAGSITLTGLASSNLTGMEASNSSTASNTGSITLSGGDSSILYGMIATDSSTISNSGTITINGSTGATVYGMYANSSSSVYNSGTITITNSSGTSYGIYADNASKVYNMGNITIDGTSMDTSTCNSTTQTGCDNFISLNNSSTFENWSNFTSSSALNFTSLTDETSSFAVAKGGSYIAPEISGTVYASSSIVDEGFETTYVNENSFVGEDTGINLLSSSYLFDANLVTNESGAQDVVMTMKSFDDVVDDNSAAQFLSQNYASQNNETMFSLFKSANNQNSFGVAVNNQLGLDFFPSFSRQNLEATKSLSRNMNNALFDNNSDEEISGFVGYDYYKKDQETSGVVQGYKENANSVYGVVEKKYTSNLHLGTGLSITQLNSKYDRGSKRKETVFNVFAPVKYQSDAFNFVSTPRIGYGFGDYKRYSGSQTYSADTNNYYYGVGNELRKDIDLNFFTLEPTAEFNVFGVYQDKTKENDQITIKSSNNVSVEGGLGLYAKKTFEIDENNAMKVRLGGTYYQEFNDANSGSTARINGMGGDYKVKGYEAQRYRAVISSRADYKYKDINFFGEASKLLEKDGSYEFNMGISLNF
ncbi:MAG: hypothetical protein ACK5N8_08820 [Alphaproteobacteria bacterium]